MQFNWKQLSAFFSLACCLSVMFASIAGAETKTIKSGLKFDHSKTGFNLVGQHALARCETCHVNGIFKGTPKQCSGCHISSNRMNASAKPALHIPTAAACETCHKSSASFAGTAMNHAGIVSSCVTCHSSAAFAGVTPLSKPANHVVTTAACETCHKSTSSFKGAGFNHTGISTGCATCHKIGGIGLAKPTNHIPSSTSCETCHKSTTSFTGARFDMLALQAAVRIAMKLVRAFLVSSLRAPLALRNSLPTLRQASVRCAIAPPPLRALNSTTLASAQAVRLAIK